MNRFLGLMGISAAIAVGGCQVDRALGPGTATGPARLELRIAGADSGVVSLLLVVSGGPIDSITATGLETITLGVAPDNYRVILRGALLTQVPARVWVPDPSAAYTATIEQAVNARYERQATANYRVQIVSQ